MKSSRPIAKDLQNHSKRVRIFYAIKLPEEVKRCVVEYTASLKSRLAARPSNVHWESIEKLHITLKFIGEINSSRLPTLFDATTRATADVKSFDLAVAGTGVFPPRGLPRVLLLGLRDESAQLSLLWHRLEDECFKEDFPRETRFFNPHLTIARLRTPAGARNIASVHREMSFETEAFTVSELIVMRSELLPKGSRYTVIARYPFGNRSGSNESA